MKIDDLTIAQAKELTRLFSGSGRSHSFQVGASYIIRTLSYHYTGRLVDVTDSDIVLEDAAWIADSGRWATALETGELSEVEPYPDRVIINRSVIVDVSVWQHALPRKTK